MKYFEEPRMEIMNLDVVDVITASGGPDDENAGEEDIF